MHDPRINTVVAIVVVALFAVGALVIIERAIMNINWMYVSIEDAEALTRTQR